MEIVRHEPQVEVFASSGAASLAEFRNQFQILYENSPIRAVKLFFYYLSARGLDPLAHAMAFWAVSGTMYISLLLDTDLMNQESVTTEVAMKAIALLPELDPQFLFKFARSLSALTDREAILRGLRLVPALMDYSILIPWLRSLSEHPDARIRSRSAKLLCQLRPNKGLIRRHLESPDPRVRASVMEALWRPKAGAMDQELLALLRSAVDDSNHRVVANALVGLYRLGESEALQKMITLCATRQHLFRAAMAWAMGEVDDARAVPALERLTLDPSFTVRKRANGSLLALKHFASGNIS
jgi:hypothetical protein